MGRRGTKSKTNGDSAPVAVNIDDNESVDQDSVENGEDPLAEVENESENESSSKKNLPKKRAAAEAKKKAKKNKKEKNESDVEEPSAEDEDYEVDKILDVQYTKSGGREFLIRWKGCGSDSDTWEPEDNLNCPELIAKFIDKQTSPKGKGRKKKAANNKPQTPAKEVNPNEEYEVERIIEVHHKKGGGREFLIRWKGCSASEDTWEPEDNLSCPDLISSFMEKVKKASNFEKREVRTAPKHTERFTLTMKATGRRISKRNGNKQRATYYDAE